MIENLKIGKKAKVSIVWNVKSVDYTKEQEKNIIQKAAKKYNLDASQITVTPDFGKNIFSADESLISDSVESIQDPKYQQSLFKKYLDSNNITMTDGEFEELLKIDSIINNQINYDTYNKSRRYSIKWLKWNNFLSFGDNNYIDFTKHKGLILLNGEPANKSGKSTFAYELIHFFLFGKGRTGKADKNEQYFNNYRPDCNTLVVEGCLCINGEDYIIRREMNRTQKENKGWNVTNKVRYYRLLPDNTEEELKDCDNMQGESVQKTNKIIIESIGSEEDFNLIVSADAKDLDELISLKDTERGQILTRWTGLSVLEDKDKLAREKWNHDVAPNMLSRTCSRVEMEERISELNEENNSLVQYSKEQKNIIDNSTKEIEKLTAQKDELLKSRKVLDSSLNNLDLHSLEVKLENLTNSGKIKRASIAKHEEELSKMPEIQTPDETEFNKVKNESYKLGEKIGELRGITLQLKEKVKSLQTSEFCPTCGHKMKDNSKLVADTQAEIDKHIEEGKKIAKEKEVVDTKLNKLESDKQYIHNRHNLELMLVGENNELNSIIFDFKDTKHKIDLIKSSSDIISFNNNIDAQVNVLSSTIYETTKIKDTAIEHVIESKKDIESNEKEILKCKANISRIEEEAHTEKLWKIYLGMIGKDGIGKLVLSTTLPTINAETNRLLDEIADFKIDIKLNHKNDVEFWMVRDDIRTRLSAASGYERTISSLALRFVLGRMSNLSKPPFLILDEILGTVAKENYDDVKKLYDKIVSNYDFVLHITHLADWTDYHDGIITIQKINNISSIKE